MKENRELWLATIFEIEGGYVNHKDDPGKATNMGITQATLADWRGEPVNPEDVAQLTKEEATSIYMARYWQTVRGDQLPSGLDLYCADFAVNSGPSRAALELQKLVKTEADSFIGPKTLEAVRAEDPLKLLLNYHSARMSFLLGLKHWDTFGRGWTNRCNRVFALSQGVIQKRPAMAEAISSTIIKANVPAAGASTLGLGWVVTEYGPLVLEWLRAKADDPATLDQLQSGAAYVGSGGLPLVVTVLGGLLAASAGVNVYTAWQRQNMWRKGEK